MNVNGREGVLTFATADASVAIEVKNYRAPGTDPETATIRSIAQIEASAGKVQWALGDDIFELEAGEVYVMVDDKLGQTIVLETPSKWIGSTDLALIDRLASENLDQELEYDRPLVVSLVERAKDEDVEIRMLASRSLSYLDRHESFVASLSNDENRSFWDAGFASAQEALARGPESAAAVRLAFEKLRGEDGEKLYRLLWGYDEDQLVELGAAKLVDDLESLDLDFRVLAFINLYRITGKMNFYQPHVTDRRRAPKVAKWRDMAEKGEITYATPPTLPLPTGVAKPAVTLP